jgi:predicted SnoaL-like aldol condensation-catalyzing enzyme
MTVEANKKLILRQFELLSAGDLAAAAALWADTSLNHGREVGPAAIEKVYSSLRSLHETHAIHEMIGEGDWVAVRTTCNGSFSAVPEFPVNSGIFSDIKPNGKAYTNQHIHLFRVARGKIVEHWANRDDLGVARQIGLELKPTQ